MDVITPCAIVQSCINIKVDKFLHNKKEGRERSENTINTDGNNFISGEWRGRKEERVGGKMKRKLSTLISFSGANEK